MYCLEISKGGAICVLDIHSTCQCHVACGECSFKYDLELWRWPPFKVKFSKILWNENVDLDLLSRSFKVKDTIPAGLGSLWLLVSTCWLWRRTSLIFTNAPLVRGSLDPWERPLTKRVFCWDCVDKRFHPSVPFGSGGAITSCLSPSHCHSWKGQSSELVSIMLKAIEMSILMHIMFQGYPE